MKNTASIILSVRCHLLPTPASHTYDQEIGYISIWHSFVVARLLVFSFCKQINIANKLPFYCLWYLLTYTKPPASDCSFKPFALFPLWQFLLLVFKGHSPWPWPQIENSPKPYSQLLDHHIYTNFSSFLF